MLLLRVFPTAWRGRLYIVNGGRMVLSRRDTDGVCLGFGDVFHNAIAVDALLRVLSVVLIVVYDAAVWVNIVRFEDVQDSLDVRGVF